MKFWMTRNKSGDRVRNFHFSEPMLSGMNWLSEKKGWADSYSFIGMIGRDLDPGELVGPLVVIDHGIYEVMKEEIRQANSEIRRLRRGASEIIDSPPFSSCRDSQLVALLEGDGIPLRPEWDHFQYQEKKNEEENEKPDSEI